MFSLDKYDTKQSIDNDISDLIKIDSRDKHLDTLIINIVQKYSLGYILEGDMNKSVLLKSIKEELKDETRRIQIRKDLLISRSKDEHYDPFEDFGGLPNGNLKSEIRDLARFLYSCDCLFDIHSTSEIFKELVLTSLKKKEDFTMLELGSGSGILSLAGTISAKRAGNININGLGLEQGNKTLIHSDKILNQLELTKEKIYILNKDIVVPSSYNYLKYFSSLDLVIAEIFSKHIPSFTFDNNVNQIVSSEKCVGEFNMKNDEARHVDPLFEGLNVLNNESNLFVNTKSNLTKLWPDVTKNHLKMNREETSLYLETIGKDVILSDIGKTFKQFESVSDLGSKRWD